MDEDADLDTLDSRKADLAKERAEMYTVVRILHDWWGVVTASLKVILFYAIFASIFQKQYQWNVSLPSPD